MPLSDLEKAEKAVEAAQDKVFAAQGKLNDALDARDLLIVAAKEPDSASLAHSVQAYQKSQKAYRISRAGKREKVRQMLEEAI